jgi:hypothetical protein
MCILHVCILHDGHGTAPRVDSEVRDQGAFQNKNPEMLWWCCARKLRLLGLSNATHSAYANGLSVDRHFNQGCCTLSVGQLAARA